MLTLHNLPLVQLYPNFSQIWLQANLIAQIFLYFVMTLSFLNNFAKNRRICIFDD